MKAHLRWPGSEHFIRASLIWGSSSSVVALVAIKAGLTSPLVFAIKDGVSYLLAFLFVRAWLRKPPTLVGIAVVAVFSLYLLLNYLYLNPSYSAPLYNIRQIVSPLVLLLIFCSVRSEPEQLERATQTLSSLVILLVIFGAAEQAFEFWKKIDLSTYFALKGIPTDSYGLSYMFYEPAFGNRERMTSTFIDPISAGHFFATAATLLFYLDGKTRREKLALTFSVIGLALSLSKGAILQFFIAGFLLNYRVSFFLRASAICVPYLLYVALPEKAGVHAHLQGLSNAFSDPTLWGHGIGAAGNYAAMFSMGGATSHSLDIYDTFIGAVVGQIGLFGTALWASIAVSLILLGLHPRRARVSVIIFASILSISVVSENTMNVTSFLMPAIIIGLARSLEQQGMFKPARSNNQLAGTLR